MNRDDGLTLVELLIVLAIVAILGALAYPSYAGSVAKARRIEAQVALIEALQQQEHHYRRHNTYLAFSAEAPGPDEWPIPWWSGQSAAASAYEIDAYACPGQDIGECVEMRARPGTGKVDASFSDPDCGTLTVNSAGEKGASGDGARCWP
jgi:type IV pilus assembly protein PilE